MEETLKEATKPGLCVYDDLIKPRTLVSFCLSALAIVFGIAIGIFDI